MAIDSFRGKNAFLSNYTTCDVELDGVSYPSTEHAYQAAKNFDPEYRKVILECGSPNESKQMGKKAQLRPDWEQVKIQIMEDLLRQKFNQDKFKKKLLDTGEEELIEGNYWHDLFWGQCPVGVGKNWLGKLLMKIRAELQREERNAGKIEPDSSIRF